MAIFFEYSHREYRPVVGDSTKLRVVLPIIVTDQGVLHQLVRYLYLRQRKSHTWKDNCVFAVQLLLDYVAVNHGAFKRPKDLFTAFANALYTGTIQDHRDASGLCWEPRQNDARWIIWHITQFTEWLSKVNDDANLKLNPWREATRHEQRLNWAARSQRKDKAFLAHLFVDRGESNKSREVRFEYLPTENQTPAKAFPEEKRDELLINGFRRSRRDGRGQIDLRNVLITILMHYGSLRLSEALSLWSDDVTVEGGEVIVRIYHPEAGLAPDMKTSRAAYLQRRYGLEPRNRLVKAINPLYLGWKNPLITDPHRKCFGVTFFPTVAGEHFVRLWQDYHLMQRVKPQPGVEHPYAFTNKNGQPYTHRMFRKAHKLAIERIGLISGKMLGTTPHGHRHAYGQRFAAAGATKITIKTAMHHASISSSDVYTQPTSSDFRKSMVDLETKLSEKHFPTVFQCLTSRDES
ncbi:gamma-mobile-trio recombinase GmtY [Pseudomonas sp. yb_2]|uniref:gamma-mobile-trio recombinase GmtY n=1 Tax=Pseudomonas sp. yb_2 TaxID=3367218 RepID=UPI00370A5167